MLGKMIGQDEGKMGGRDMWEKSKPFNHSAIFKPDRIPSTFWILKIEEAAGCPHRFTKCCLVY
jgi:hypothetical protein